MSDTIKEVDRMLVEAAAKLTEHCDSVIILVTLETGDKNFVARSCAKGNVFAGLESCREFLQRDYRKSKFDHENQMKEGEEPRP